MKDVEKPLTFERVLEYLKNANILDTQAEQLLEVIVKDKSNKVISFIIKD